MAAQGETSTDQDTIEFQGSQFTEWFYIGACVVIALGFWFGLSDDRSLLDAAIDIFVVIILLMGTVMLIQQYKPVKGPVVTLTPEGLRDRRVADAFIPWSAVQMIQPQRNIGSRSLMVTVDPGTHERLGLAAQSGKLPSELIQIRGDGLKVPFGTLRDACMGFAQRYGPNSLAG